MLLLSEELSCGQARLRVDVHGTQPLEHLLNEMTYLNYRLASVQVHKEITESAPGLVWHQDAPEKSIRYQEGTLILEGDWYQGELQKILISMLALQMEEVGSRMAEQG